MLPKSLDKMGINLTAKLTKSKTIDQFKVQIYM